MRRSRSSVRGEIERRAVGARQREAHRRKGDRDARDHIGDRGGLGALALHEFQPRGRGEEQIAHLDRRARDWRRRAGRRRRCRPRQRFRPPSAAAVRERIDRRDTEPIEGSASPRKPSERMSSMSLASFDVQWRATASASSSRRNAASRRR